MMSAAQKDSNTETKKNSSENKSGKIPDKESSLETASGELEKNSPAPYSNILTTLYSIPTNFGLFVWDVLMGNPDDIAIQVATPTTESSVSVDEKQERALKADESLQKNEEDDDQFARRRSSASVIYYSDKIHEGMDLKLINRKADKKEWLLNNEIAIQLRSVLPSRLKFCDEWTLLYSTYEHGTSLNTLYNASKGKGPSVLILKDADDQVFGAFGTDPWHLTQGHYGTGECFIFKILEDASVKVFGTTGKNDYYMMSEPSFIAIGCGEGEFGLYLDSKLINGSSKPVPTFDNEVLSKSSQFECLGLELWGFKGVADEEAD